MQLRGTLALLVLLLLSGCIGSTILDWDGKGDKNDLETPSLHTVPDRPQKAPPGERETMIQDMKDDFQKSSKDLEG